ncbi:ATP-binding protein [Salinibaculum rarum]|uniref:ATP-binding protein n=1 Tax=Salinibaculum rarum TaxID=3058903 RepID=UPI00265D7E6B|nr:ATP-binding protein [Salinibaculum sp. KK48]
MKADSRLKVAILEAVDNAVSHQEQSKPAVDINVTQPTDSDRWVEIVVADSGPGIPSEDQMAIEMGEETAIDHGSGIGLWLIHWIVVSFGGEIQIDENDPAGSVVTLRLPTTGASSE